MTIDKIMQANISENNSRMAYTARIIKVFYRFYNHASALRSGYERKYEPSWKYWTMNFMLNLTIIPFIYGIPP